MKIYYLQSVYQLGKHRIVKVLYNDEVFKFDEGTLSPFNTLTIDEIDPANKILCLDLARTVNKTDNVGEGKYYVDATSALMEKASWTEYVLEVI
ncbi:MAG: hypothetical protein HY891_07760 [Deltaproteobacteria bacterium]|nr:hypothetical protein [Deltaproteobacteria bacterium]